MATRGRVRGLNKEVIRKWFIPSSKHCKLSLYFHVFFIADIYSLTSSIVLYYRCLCLFPDTATQNRSQPLWKDVQFGPFKLTVVWISYYKCIINGAVCLQWGSLNALHFCRQVSWGKYEIGVERDELWNLPWKSLLQKRIVPSLPSVFQELDSVISLNSDAESVYIETGLKHLRWQNCILIKMDWGLVNRKTWVETKSGPNWCECPTAWHTFGKMRYAHCISQGDYCKRLYGCFKDPN